MRRLFSSLVLSPGIAVCNWLPLTVLQWAVCCSGAINLEELQSLLSNSIMIRRLKKDVLTQLPAKQRQKITFHLKDSDSKKALFRSVILLIENLISQAQTDMSL